MNQPFLKPLENLKRIRADPYTATREVSALQRKVEIPAIQQFEHDVIQNCLKYVYLGCGVFTAATIQAMCFLTVCENLVNQLRRQFFKSILRQDITWFDKNNSGTLATKLFE
ncbi:hypothetical protein OSTOST_11385 [Ostertagia ostertagi]